MEAYQFAGDMGKEQKCEERGMMEQFTRHAQVLDVINEKRERLVKASRDVTIHSKKVIFQLHRISAEKREEILNQAEKDLEMIRTQQISRVASELQGDEYWKFRRAYSPGVQEYVEAASLSEFCKHGSLLMYTQVNDSFSEIRDAFGDPFTISVADYVLGLADLTGELMRLAVSGAGSGKQVYPARDVGHFVGSMYHGFNGLPKVHENSHDMFRKVEVMRESLLKIEKVNYAMQLRRAEYPEVDLPATCYGDAAEPGQDL